MNRGSVLVVMGVSGSGKTTVGSLLAGRLGWVYAEADGFHRHFFKAEMLASQFADLEPPAPDEAAIAVPIDGTPAEIVDAVIAAARRGAISAR